MLLRLIQHGAMFLSENPMLIGMVMSAMEFLKKGLESQAWFQKDWVRVGAVFVMAALFVMPEVPAFSMELLAEIFAVGGAAAGLFSVGASLAKKAK